MVLTLLVVLSIISSASGPQTPCEVPSRTEGFLRFRGDSWPIRLDLDRSGSRDSALMDLPDLVLSGLPVPIECLGDSLRLDLPFGLGTMALASAPGEAVLHGGKVLGGDSLSLRLEPTTAPPYTIRPVEFRNGSVVLHGSLYLPAGAGPVPALVMAHGSGPIGRSTWAYRSWGDFFARMGIATLAYDKRGVGESAGNYLADSAFAGLAGDLAAAIAVVRGQPGIDPSRVGIGGHSQAAWVAALAAGSAHPAFIVLMAGPSVSVAEQELQRVEYGMREEGYTPTEIAQAVQHTRLVFAVAVTGRGWDALEASSARLASDEWAEWVQRPDSLAALGWWRTHATVDPAGFLSRTRVPILALYSEQDPLVPAAANAGRMRELLRGGHTASRVKTLAEGDHRLELAGGRDGQGAWHFPRLNPSALATIREWLSGLLRLPPS